MAEREEEVKSLLMKMKEESGKTGLKLNIQNTKIMVSITKIRAPGPVTSWQMQRKWKQWQALFSWAPKLLQAVTVAMKLKDAGFLEETYDKPHFSSVHFNHSVVLTVCDPMDCSMPGFPVHH